MFNPEVPLVNAVELLLEFKTLLLPNFNLTLGVPSSFQNN
jgi:hypothetical protein